jgi:hypothetical protein
LGFFDFKLGFLGLIVALIDNQKLRGLSWTCGTRNLGYPMKTLKENSDMTMEKKTSTTKSELDRAIKEARESGKVAARKEVGEWIEANMLNGPYYTVYSSIFPSIIKRLKEGKRL